MRYKASLPTFSCHGPQDTEQIPVNCRFVLDHETSVMLLAYQLRNKTEQSQLCTTFIQIGSIRKEMHKDISITAHAVIQQEVLLPYPLQDVKAQLTSECQEGVLRKLSESPKKPEKPSRKFIEF